MPSVEGPSLAWIDVLCIRSENRILVECYAHTATQGIARVELATQQTRRGGGLVGECLRRHGWLVWATEEFVSGSQPPTLSLRCLHCVAAFVGRNLVDPASSHMLVSKIKPCMSQYKLLYGETANGSLKQL